MKTNKLQLGDQLTCPASGGSWIVRSALPGRLRLVSDDLRDNPACGASLQRLAAHHPQVAQARLNLRAGSLVLERIGVGVWQRAAVQSLLDQLGSPQQQATLATWPEPSLVSPPRGPLLRLSLAGLLALAQASLAPAWMLPIGLLLLPPLLLPLLRQCLRPEERGSLPRETLDLIWYVSLMARGQLDTLATQLAMDNGGEILRGPIRQAGRSSENLSAELRRWMDQVHFPLAEASSPPRALAALQRGDRIRLGPGDVVPLEAQALSGEAVISKQLLDGDPLPLAVVAGDALPVGMLVLQGELIVQLQQELAEQPLYQQLLQLNPHDAPSEGIERARQLHRQLVPIQLGGAMVALLLGRPHEAAALVQFDPMNDWQLSASVAYRGARSLCTGWGVRLLNATALDRLSHCRTLVIAETALCAGIERQLCEVVSLDARYDVDALVEIAAGFRRFLQPQSIALLPLQDWMEARQLRPRAVEDLQPHGSLGLSGRLDGQSLLIGDGDLLDSLGLARPPQLARQGGLHWLFVVVERQLVGGLLFRDQLDRQVSRSLRRLRRHGWRLHLVSTWHGEMLQGLARQLRLPAAAVHPSLDLQQRLEWIRQFDRSQGTVAYLGASLLDSGAFAAADIALAVSDGSPSLPFELADLVLPAGRLDRLVDCVTIARLTGLQARQNFYLTLLPHGAALLLSLVVRLDPLIAVLLADLPMLLAEFNNLKTYQQLHRHHRLGWRAQRKRTSRRRPATLAPLGVRSRQVLGSG
jgi:cation transport ATPase